MMERKISFCTRCWLPSTYPTITFNKQGVCNVCEDNEMTWGSPPKSRGLEPLRELLKEKVNDGGRFQAVVTVSGGKDSAYVLYLAVKILKLKVLAANFDNGFQTISARQNLEKICEKLEVPLLIFKPPKIVLYKLYRKFWQNTGDFCTPCCIGCCASGFYAARAAGTKIIMHGGIGGSAFSSNVLRMFVHSYDRYIKYSDGAVKKWLQESIAFNGDEINKFTLISVPQYLDWQQKKVLGVITEKLGWAAGKIQHSDCRMDTTSDYFLVRKYGFSKAWQNTSMLLRTGQITFQEALKIIKEETIKPTSGLKCFRNEVLASGEADHQLYKKQSLYGELVKWVKRNEKERSRD